MSITKLFGGVSEPAGPKPTLAAARPAVATPPPAPEQSGTLPPELLLELARLAGTAPAAPPAGPQAAPQRDEGIQFSGTLDGGVLDRIHACRNSIEAVLGSSSKEFQVLKLLEETNLGVCSELADNLRSRLSEHPLYQIKSKLDEAYTLALRYRKP